MIYIVLWQKNGILEKETFTTIHEARGYAKRLINNGIPDSFVVDITKVEECFINTSLIKEDK